ncbi:hypothetical protein O181_060926 [Austropuccinia psidii MF-1]|uniref:Integrase zinc-binding domain-containing protein n=1 Tax=Austropuccinia psidii MF-1 TaxID=1389203 RepID=A0A9Q3ELT5_9BASI|nr:hypothetical protein [Austropuccinia psidii MF-1]
MTVVDRSLIDLVLKECHDIPFSGHLSEDRTREKVKNCIWWPMWQKDLAEYFKTCYRCQKENQSPGKRLGNMIKIKEPRRPWEIVHMDWVTGLPPGGYQSYNECLVIVDRTKLSFSTAYHPETDGLAEIMIQTLEDMVRRFCAYVLELKDCKGFTHDWCTLLPALELEYRTFIHASTNQTAAILEKGWNPRLPQDSLREDLVEIHPTASSFKEILEKARKNEVRLMKDSFASAKDKWDKSHATSDFKVGDLVLLSVTKFNNIKRCEKMKEYFSGPFLIKALHGVNVVEVELAEELSKRHPTFPVSLIKKYRDSDSGNFHFGNKAPQNIPSVEPSGMKEITKILKELNLKTKKVREHLVRYSDPACEDE